MVFRFGPRVDGNRDRPGRQFKPCRCKVVNPRRRKDSNKDNNLYVYLFLDFFFLTNPLLRLWRASVSISFCGFVSLLLNSTS